MENIMNKRFFLSLISGIFIVILYKTGGLFSSTPAIENVDTALTLYDIGFVKESGHRPLPDIELVRHGSKDQAFKLKDLIGKPVMVHFWGTDCPPCKAELPAYSKFVKAHPEIEAVTLTILPTSMMSKEKVKAGLVRFGADDVPLITEEKGYMAGAFDVIGIPTTVFINAKGNVVGSVAGAIDWNNPAVTALLLAALAV
jgi:thiol-disulfide isomerase/thioredoxin